MELASSRIARKCWSDDFEPMGRDSGSEQELTGSAALLLSLAERYRSRIDYYGNKYL